MTRKGRRKPKPVLGDPHDPDGFGVWTRRYLEALRIQNYSERTVENRESYLGVFVTWCEARSIVRPREVTKPILERYQRHLFHLRKENGKPLSFRAQYARLMPVRGLFKWLARQNVLLWNPASDLDLPRPEHRLPKHVLTANEAERVLGEPDLRDPLGVRDRAILETFYATGIRRTELLRLDDDREHGSRAVAERDDEISAKLGWVELGESPDSTRASAKAGSSRPSGPLKSSAASRGSLRKSSTRPS